MERKVQLAFLLPVRCVVFFTVFVLGAFFTKQGLEQISFWWSIVATVVNFLTILLLFFVVKQCGGSYFELVNLKNSFEKGQTTWKQIIFILVLSLVVGMSGMYLAGFICYGVIPYFAPMMVEPVPLVFAILNVLLLPVTTALAEDGLYLGCGVNQIKNKFAAVLIPAFFYALQHCFIPTLFDFKFLIYRFLSFLPLTVIFCWWFYKKRNPLPIMIGHAVLDIATVVTILVFSV